MVKLDENQLNQLGFSKFNDPIEYISKDMEYQFNILTNELFCINDGIGEPEFIVKINNYKHFVDILQSLNYF